MTSGSRRWLLRMLGVAGISALAGCNTDTDAPTQTGGSTLTADPSATATATAQPGDTSAPVVDKFTARYTDAAGEVAVSLEGHDENLDTARISTPATDLTRSPNGTRVTVDTEMQGKPGRINDVTARLEDATGNRAEETVDSYVRKYEPLADPEIDFAAVYIPFLGSKWGKCIPRSTVEPRIGHYDSTFDPEAVNRHVDQMLGHGITTAIFNYNGKLPNEQQAVAFQEAALTSEIAVEPYYIIGHAMKWAEDGNVAERLRDDMDFMYDTFLSRDNARTLDGRPVVHFWGTRTLSYVEWAGQDKGEDPYAVAHEWEGVGDFLDELRSRLAVDGREPYLIGEFRNHGVGEVPDIVDEDAINWNGQFFMTDGLREVAAEMDAVSTWTGLLYKGQRTPWDVAYEVSQKNYEGLRAFADEHDADFIPTVFPGFDDRHNTCWGADRHKPRSVDHLRQMLALADEYRTRDRINVATWNGWPEGHQIEPGTFDGEDYGTDYLEIVEEYQRGDTE